MITSLKVGDKFTVPEKFDLSCASFEPDVVYTVVEALEDKDSYTIEPGFGWNNQWHIGLVGLYGEPEYNNFEPYPAEETSTGDPLKDALEILESSGPLPYLTPEGSPEAFEAVARESLKKAIRVQVRMDKELEDLALKLMNANNGLFGAKNVSDWSEVDSSSVKAHWVDVAKEAKKFFSNK